MEDILIKNENGTCTITLNRPDVYNALNRETKLELISQIRKAGRDESVKSIVLTGAGKAFSTGQDLNDRTVSDGPSVDLGYTLETEWNPLVNAIRESEKIVIGAINGVVAGAGISVALACDFIYAKNEIKFVSGFANIGLCPDAGSSFIFARALGYQKALEFFLTNKPMMSEDLEKVGLVNYVGEDFLEKANEMASKINGMAPLSVQNIKKNLQFALDQDFKESMRRETYTQRFLGNSKDYQEGLKAFFEKRKPEFKGH
ncbi:MAG: 2-(1,2-epoxy-1,2-dihydrophenyl)acetyl-CoA isomerase [Halobacteriovorax sp.]|nr:2-(1,2-epoxy-1,2-dihydrophenyl)acetyl-CoA isomerase [Halobacteriovorax sp.]|tara:strand:+ start:57060 stop:57836 length:777 start_codon:yes stop_codon:yes gene_type:complete